MTARYLIGDVFARMAELPDASVDLIMCSPPFLALRSYLPADHPDKGKEIGSEATPAAFIDTLLALTEVWRRVLAPHGSICIELGDTYSGAGAGGGDNNLNGTESLDGPGMARRGKKRSSLGYVEAVRRWPNADWPLAKSLALVPELYRVALAYGVNPLTGTPSPAGRWRVRNVVRWHRPNPPVGALGDKFRPATSDMVIACTSAKRYFDLDAVREPHARDYTNEIPSAPKGNGHTETRMNPGQTRHYTLMSNPAGAPPLDTWVIPTEPFKGAHYATWPRDLCVKPILAMCPERVCRTCGKPRERITETTNGVAWNPSDGHDRTQRRENATTTNLWKQATGDTSAARATLGFSDCGHDNYRRGLVLDCFAGSGTTLAVATGLGRDCIGIDLDERNQWLARERVGMFLEVGEAVNG